MTERMTGGTYPSELPPQARVDVVLRAPALFNGDGLHCLVRILEYLYSYHFLATKLYHGTHNVYRISRLVYSSLVDITCNFMR